jgi:uncharacterized protein
MPEPTRSSHSDVRIPLPPYSYVPGRFPHPLRDPHGHSFGHSPPPLVLRSAGEGRNCREFLRGVELFDHGYYWEAHESWEAVWIALGRRGREADFVKGLIKLAAAGVKAREGRPEGVARHARRAAELFRAVAGAGSEARSFWGMSLAELIRSAEKLQEAPDAVIDVSPAPVVKVLPLDLSRRSQQADSPP